MSDAPANGATAHQTPRHLGISGRLTRATIQSPLTPLFLLAAMIVGLIATITIPREEEPQIKVPMVWWLSAALKKSCGLDQTRLKKQTTKPWAHDELFHTVLGLLQVQTSVYERKFDISAGCRPE